MNSTIIFLSIFILFLSLILTFKIQICFDLMENKILIKVYLYNIKILVIKVGIVGLTYQINNSKKIKSLNIIIPKEERYFLSQIKSSIIDKLYYDDIIFSSSIGLGDAAQTAIAYSFINITCSIIANSIYAHNHDTLFFYNNAVNFAQNNISFDLNIKVHFTIFDLVFAIIMSIYKRGKYVKETTKKR